MTLVPKDWQDAPSTATPITAAALEDLETRLGAYTDGARQTIDVTDSAYGALGNGAADDTAEIQAAINASVGAVFFPAGTYLVSADLTVPSNRLLYGEGPATIIKRTGSTTAVVFKNSDLTNGNTDITIRGMTLDRTEGADALDPYDNCILFRYVTRGYVEGVRTRGGMKGIHLTGCLRTVILSCMIDSFRDNGIAINDPTGIGGASPTGPQVTITDCILNQTAATQSAAGSSVVLVSASNVIVTGCQVNTTVDLLGAGMELGLSSTFEPDDCRFEGNIFIGCGLHIGAGERHVIANNTASDGTLPGSARLRIEATASGTPARNRILDNAVFNDDPDSLGAIETKAPFSVVQGNYTTGLGSRIWINDADDCVVTDNVAEGADNEGFRGSLCARLHMSGNTARDCGQEDGAAATEKCGFVFDSLSDPIIVDSAAHSSLSAPNDMKHGFYIHDSTAVVWRDNRARGHATSPVVTTGTQSWQAAAEMPSIASAATVLLTEFSDAFNITGTATIDTITATNMAGRVKYLKFASTAAVSEAGNVKLVGTATFTASADDTLTLVSDGTSWYEVARSVN